MIIMGQRTYSGAAAVTVPQPKGIVDLEGLQDWLDSDIKDAFTAIGYCVGGYIERFLDRTFMKKAAEAADKRVPIVGGVWTKEWTIPQASALACRGIGIVLDVAGSAVYGVMRGFAAAGRFFTEKSGREQLMAAADGADRACAFTKRQALRGISFAKLLKKEWDEERVYEKGAFWDMAVLAACEVALEHGSVDKAMILARTDVAEGSWDDLLDAMAERGAIERGSLKVLHDEIEWRKLSFEAAMGGWRRSLDNDRDERYNDLMDDDDYDDYYEPGRPMR